MRTVLRLVALACVAQMMASSVLFGRAGKLSSAEITKRLGEKELSPRETFELLTSPGAGNVFGSHSAQSFVHFADFKAEDCTKLGMEEHEQFIETLEKENDRSQAFKNLMGFCQALLGDMVKYCKKVNPDL